MFISYIYFLARSIFCTATNILCIWPSCFMTYLTYVTCLRELSILLPSRVRRYRRETLCQVFFETRLSLIIITISTIISWRDWSISAINDTWEYYSDVQVIWFDKIISCLLIIRAFSDTYTHWKRIMLAILNLYNIILYFPTVYNLLISY